MNVLLVYPNLDSQIGFNYGLAHIAAALKAERREVSLLNVNEKLGFPLDIERVQREARQVAPKLVGFSVVTNQFQNTVKIAAAMRDVTDAPFVCGGIHATIAPEDIMATGLFDFVCVGEGELAMLDLVGSLERGEDPSRIPNMWTKRRGRLVRNPVRPFVDGTRLPPKDYDVFEFQKMIDAKDG